MEVVPVTRNMSRSMAKPNIFRTSMSVDRVNYSTAELEQYIGGWVRVVLPEGSFSPIPNIVEGTLRTIELKTTNYGKYTVHLSFMPAESIPAQMTVPMISFQLFFYAKGRWQL